MSYSQNNEEEIILKLAPERGTFLDIGAADGETYSNTRALFERGWGGVMVEPSIFGFQSLLAKYGYSQRVRLIHAAMGPIRCLCLFWDTRDLVATTNLGHWKKWTKDGGYLWPYLVPTITFDDLGEYEFDMLNIDTEGTSADLLLSYPFDRSKPKIICVEHDGREEELHSFLDPCGYKFILRNEENAIFNLEGLL